MLNAEMPEHPGSHPKGALIGLEAQMFIGVNCVESLVL